MADLDPARREELAVWFASKGPWPLGASGQADALAPLIARWLADARAEGAAEVRARVEAAACACGGDAVRHTVGADRRCPVHGYGRDMEWRHIRAALADPTPEETRP